MTHLNKQEKWSIGSALIINTNPPVLSVHLTHFVLTRKKKPPRYLNSFDSLSTQSTVFPQRTMASDLELLVFHPNHFTLDGKLPPVHAEGLDPMKPNRTTSSAKRRNSEVPKLDNHDYNKHET